MKKLIIFIIMIPVFIYGIEVGNYDFARMQKLQMFGTSYSANYKYWLGIKGYGFGASLGQIGTVGGLRLDLSKFSRVVKDYRQVVDEMGNVKQIEVEKIESLKGELYFDSFIYVDLKQLVEFPEYIGGWLFWEINVWFGLR